jgi:hypothetical protein
MIKHLQKVEIAQELITDELYVEKDVYADSIIEAKILEVKGVTHKESTQYVRDAKINISKGTIRCHSVEIDNLQDGEVHATYVKINNMSGGSVYAQEVEIQTLNSNAKIIAAKSISIKKLLTKNSVLKINYSEVPVIESKIELIEDDVNEYISKLTKAKKYNPLEIPHIKNNIQNLKKQLQDILNSTYNAQIQIGSVIPQNTHIIFSHNNNDIKYVTKNKQYKSFYFDKETSSIKY